MAKKSKTGGIPKGWCARPPDKFGGKSGGLKTSQADPDSYLNVYYKKFPKVKSKGATGATMGVTYGCPKGKWKKKSKKSVKGGCDTGMRVVRIMKPKSRVMKSKSRRKYKCRKG